MLATVDVTITCTIQDQFRVMELARKEVEEIKPLDDRSLYYPSSPSEALQQLIRTAIASKLLATDAVVLHEIVHKMRNVEMPL